MSSGKWRYGAAKSVAISEAVNSPTVALGQTVILLPPASCEGHPTGPTESFSFAEVWALRRRS